MKWGNACKSIFSNGKILDIYTEPDWNRQWDEKENIDKRQDKKEKGKMTLHYYKKRKCVWIVVILGYIVRAIFYRNCNVYIMELGNLQY